MLQVFPPIYTTQIELYRKVCKFENNIWLLIYCTHCSMGYLVLLQLDSWYQALYVFTIELLERIERLRAGFNNWYSTYKFRSNISWWCKLFYFFHALPNRLIMIKIQRVKSRSQHLDGKVKPLLVHCITARCLILDFLSIIKFFCNCYNSITILFIRYFVRVVSRFDSALYKFRSNDSIKARAQFFSYFFQALPNRLIMIKI